MSEQTTTTDRRSAELRELQEAVQAPLDGIAEALEALEAARQMILESPGAPLDSREELGWLVEAFQDLLDKADLLVPGIHEAEVDVEAVRRRRQPQETYLQEVPAGDVAVGDVVLWRYWHGAGQPAETRRMTVTEVRHSAKTAYWKGERHGGGFQQLNRRLGTTTVVERVQA